jgi:hypothetical protein
MYTTFQKFSALLYSGDWLSLYEQICYHLFCHDDHFSVNLATKIHNKMKNKKRKNMKINFLV